MYRNATNLITPSIQGLPHLAWWSGSPEDIAPQSNEDQILKNITKTIHLILKDGYVHCVTSGELSYNLQSRPTNSFPVLATLPPCNLEMLGDPLFLRDHSLRYAYIGGSMAHGISSVNLATKLASMGMIGFFGSAGESLKSVESSIMQLKNQPEPIPFGVNLIHSPNESSLEDALVDLYFKHEIKLIEASAYLTMSLPLVRYRVSGIYQNENGEIVAPNKIIAKVSRVEVASQFFSPPPPKMLGLLIESGHITEQQANMASQIPVAQDLTSEADSGGHTDNRPAVTLHPTMVALKNRLQNEYKYQDKLRVGFGGGICTPASAAAAFAMGAAYIVTGTVNQACIESGTSDLARQMLAQASQADTIMAPAGDMFEMGVTVQVLKRGTMFAMRAQKLYDLFRRFKSIEEIPAPERAMIEKTIFQHPLETVWEQTVSFFQRVDPHQITKAEADPHHKMALIFKWYLGQSPRWAQAGDKFRQLDFQIWCGPSIGGFNEWTKNSHLEKTENRTAGEVAMNLLFGAALELRSAQIRTQGLQLNQSLTAPHKLEEINKYIF